MAITQDAVSVNYDTANLNPSVSHAGASSGVRGVLVLAVMNSKSHETATATYGGASMTEVALSPASKSTGEDAVAVGFFLGASVSQGTQTAQVTWSGSATAEKQMMVVTYTADNDMSVVDTSTIILDSSGVDPSVTLSLSGDTCACAQIWMSGRGTTSGVSSPTGWTNQAENDAGSAIVGGDTYDTIGSSDVSAGLVQASDDIVLLGVAVKESAAAASYTLTADSGSYTYTGTDSAVSAGRYVAGDSGTYAYTGTGAGILVGYGLVADGGSYAVTGTAAQLLLAAHIASDAGSYALTGSTAGLLFGARITSDSGAYAVTGATAELSRDAHIASDAGAYAYTGSDAALTYGSDNTLVADAGGYTYTGADAALQADRDLAADSGAYAYTGTAALLAQGYIMQADSGAYVLSGAVVDFLKTHALVADSGAYVITGTVVELLYGALGPDAVRALRHTLSPDFLRTSASPVKRRHTITPSNQRHTIG